MQAAPQTNGSNSLLDAVRKPKAAVILTLTIALMINLVLGAYMTLPSYLAVKNAGRLLADKEQELARMSALPEPPRASEEDAAALKAKLPIRIDSAELLQQYYGYSLETGTILTAISTLGVGGETGSGNGGETGALLASSAYRLTAIGAMPRLMELYEKISTSGSLTDVPEWNMLPATGADAKKYSTMLAGSEELYTLEMTVKVYTMSPAIAEKLGE